MRTTICSIVLFLLLLLLILSPACVSSSVIRASLAGSTVKGETVEEGEASSNSTTPSIPSTGANPLVVPVLTVFNGHTLLHLSPYTHSFVYYYKSTATFASDFNALRPAAPWIKLYRVDCADPLSKSLCYEEGITSFPEVKYYAGPGPGMTWRPEVQEVSEFHSNNKTNTTTTTTNNNNNNYYNYNNNNINLTILPLFPFPSSSEVSFTWAGILICSSPTSCRLAP